MGWSMHLVNIGIFLMCLCIGLFFFKITFLNK